MQNTLSEMWQKYNLLSQFKTEMNKRGYTGRDLYVIVVQMELLNKLIEVESINVLSELLKKTYYRLLKSIDRGIDSLPIILENPEMWILNPIEKDSDAWRSKDALIFSTKTTCAVFNKASINNVGFKYIDSKWQ